MFKFKFIEKMKSKKNPYYMLRDKRYRNEGFNEWNLDVLRNVIVGYAPKDEKLFIEDMTDEEFIKWFVIVFVKKDIYVNSQDMIGLWFIMSDMESRFGYNFTEYVKMLRNSI